MAKTCESCGRELNESEELFDVARCSGCTLIRAEASAPAPAVEGDRPWHQTWWGAAIIIWIPLAFWYAIYVWFAKLSWRGRGAAAGTFVGTVSTMMIVLIVLGLFRRQDDEARLDELFSRARDAYAIQAEEQARIDEAFGDCSPSWIDATARNNTRTVATLARISSTDTLEQEVRGQLEVLCETGDVHAYCLSAAASLARAANEPQYEVDYREGCEFALEQFLASFGSNLREGDCVSISSDDQFRDVACEDLHDGRVLAVGEIEESVYPGMEAVDKQVDDFCLPFSPFIWMSYPSPSTWRIGDRTMICVLPVDFDLHSGDCLVYQTQPTETYFQRLACDREHDAEVAAVIDVPGEEFPGEPAFDQLASESCPAESDDWLFPTSGAWALGDRELICLELDIE